MTPLLRLLFLLVSLPLALGAAPPAWQQWDGCTHVADRYFDGDSFQVKHRGKIYVLRSYFIDAPETDESYAGRVAEQAAYFGVTTAQTLRAGEDAKAFVARFLSRPFRVYTRLQAAPGASRQERHYAIIERDGVRLDAALVEAGLARTTSEVADFPDTEAGRRRDAELRSREERAAFARKGLWASSQRKDRQQSLLDKLKPILTGKGGATPAPHRVNLNTASEADLLALPGIGPKTAAAIIAARPLADVQALDQIPGIGPQKIAALKDRVRF